MGAESDISDGFEGGGATPGGLAPLAPLRPLGAPGGAGLAPLRPLGQ